MMNHLSMFYLLILMLVATTRAQHASLQVESSGGCVASVNKELHSPNSTIFLKCEELKCSKEGWIPTKEQDPDCELPFFAAVAKGEISNVKEFLEKGMSPNTKNKKGASIALKAIQNEHIEILKTLLENGTDPQAPTALSHEESTLVLYAAAHASLEVIDVLLCHGANINKHVYGSTPLRNAIKRKDIRIIKHLIEHNVDVNEVNIYQDATVLIGGVSSGSKDIVTLLIANGAEVNDIAINGITALQKAVTLGDNEIVKLLLVNNARIHHLHGGRVLSEAIAHNHLDIAQTLLEYGADPNEALHGGDTALILAARDDNLDIVIALIENGANTSITNDLGDSALTLATSRNHTKIVTTLLENYANPNIINDNGDSALTLAASRNHTNIVTTLLENGANPNIIKGKVPLIEAVLKESIDIVKILLDNNANVDASDELGHTALIIAAQGGNLDIVKTLLENGANISSTTARGFNALIIAAQEGNLDIVKILLENGANISSTTALGISLIEHAIDDNQAGAVEALLTHGVDPNQKTKDGSTLLVSAVKNDNVDMVAVLLNNKAQADATDGRGNSALSWAAQKGNVQIVQLLLDHGANVSSADASGNTPLIYAAQFGQNEVVRNLINNGAKIDLSNKAGESPLLFATLNRRNDVIETLISRGADVTLQNERGVSPISLATKHKEQNLVAFQLLSEGDHGGVHDHSQRMVCYLGSWAVYRPGMGKFSIEDIDATLCNNLVYTFVGLDEATFKVKSLDPEYDINEKAFERFVGLKKQNPDLEVTIAIGGWTEGSKKYSAMAKNTALRRVFIDSIVAFIKEHNFDGLDLSWEFPANRGGVPEDKNNFVTLVKELRQEFDKHDWLLTAALGAGKATIESAYNVKELARYLDYIHVMAYDYHGKWDGKTGHNAPLYSRDDESDAEKTLNVEYTVNYYLQLGCPPEKLVMGLGLYGRSFLLQNASNPQFGAPTQPTAFAGPYTREDGFLGYNEICEKQKSEANLWKVVWQKAHQAPYMFMENMWVSYDDENSLNFKTSFAQKKGLAGVMVWSIDTDDFKGNCFNGKTFPLLRAINKSLVDKKDQRP